MCNYLSTLLSFETLCVLGVLVSYVHSIVISEDTLESVVRSPRASNLTHINQGSEPIVNMNGNYNYQAVQQVFFISGAQEKVSKRMKNCVTYLERDDYTVRPGIGVHKLHKRKVTWNKARKSCMDEGASLAVLNSAQEEEVLVNWMNQEDVGYMWLGLHDQFEEGVWVTITGEPLDTVGYENWWKSERWPNQPDNFGGNQNCGNLVKFGGMDDTTCDSLHAYMCEINLC